MNAWYECVCLSLSHTHAARVREKDRVGGRPAIADGIGRIHERLCTETELSQWICVRDELNLSVITSTIDVHISPKMSVKHRPIPLPLPLPLPPPPTPTHHYHHHLLN